MQRRILIFEVVVWPKPSLGCKDMGYELIQNPVMSVGDKMAFTRTIMLSQNEPQYQGHEDGLHYLIGEKVRTVGESFSGGGSKGFFLTAL